MSTLRLVIVLALGAVTTASAQLAITQPTEKLLVLAIPVAAPADSAASVQAMDLARERLIALARYKVLTVPKPKICEALGASGFPCDILMAEQQASQLARSLSVNAYTTGLLSRNSASYTARIRISEGSSGFGMIWGTVTMELLIPTNTRFWRMKLMPMAVISGARRGALRSGR